MSEIVLFHSVLGVVDGVLDGAERLRAAGHQVHVPDLYDGVLFDDYGEAGQYVESFGSYPELMRRSAAAVAELPAELVYAGFSNGGGSAIFLGATRPGALGVLALHAALPLELFGAEAWPPSVPVQVHYGAQDPFRHEESVRQFGVDVKESGAKYEYFDYPGVAGHLFTDADRTEEYDREAAELMWSRAIEFVDRLG
jgi:dienelactone hydrolase